jgi:hypothetical protein
MIRIHTSLLLLCGPWRLMCWLRSLKDFQMILYIFLYGSDSVVMIRSSFKLLRNRLTKCQMKFIMDPTFQPG